MNRAHSQYLFSVNCKNNGNLPWIKQHFTGSYFPLFVALLFIAFLYFIGMTENSTVQLLRVKGIKRTKAVFSDLWLYLFAGLLGLWGGIQLFNVFDFTAKSRTSGYRLNSARVICFPALLKNE